MSASENHATARCVRTARRRMTLGLLGRNLSWSLFVAAVVAGAGIAAARWIELPGEYSTWVLSWLMGCAAIAVVVAAAATWWQRPSSEVAAVEIDRRFGLRDRLASSMSLETRDQASPFGHALEADADRHAEAIRLSEQFPLRPRRIVWYPLAMLPALLLAFWIGRSAMTPQVPELPPDAVEVRQVKAVAKQLKKQIAAQKRKAESQGLEDAKDLFEKMEADIDRMTGKKNMDRKEAMIALNDLKKQLEERREQLGSSEQMRKMMSQMKGIGSGPGEKIAKSIQRGDFSQAQKMVQDLAKKMRDGKLSEGEKKQLQKQVQQMADAMKDQLKKQEQKKKELQRQIEQAKKEGRSQEADKMQQELQKMQNQQQQMQQMQQMAEAMQQAAQSMQQGDASEAAQAMQEMAEQLGDMQSEMEQLQDLQSSLDDIAQSKHQMRCKQCNGDGCQGCQGGFGQDSDKPGQGLGKGAGKGDRPEAEEDTNTYETQVRGDVRKGKAVITGFADGPNRKGATREAIKQSVESAIQQESDPSENQVLPRTEREHARQYFDQLRKR